MGPFKRIATTVVVALAAVSLGFQSTPARATTSATLRGLAICSSGRTVVGVWVESSAGDSGWASFTLLPGHANMAYYLRTPITFSSSTTSVYVTVGCGGTSQSWASSSSSPAKTISGTYIYNIYCSDPTTGSGSCSGAPYPSYGSANPGYSGQCTWGAAEMWKKATGHYPSWSGNANDWNNNAKAKGFRVLSTPHERAIAVWEANVGGASSYGHVAWVTKTSVSGSTIYFYVHEMNWTNGVGKWDDRKVTFVSGMSFIVAPPGVPVLS